MPEPVTEEAPAIFELWKWSWVAALIVGVIVWGLIGYAALRFRRRSDDEVPVQMRYNLPIETFYTIAPVVMVIVFFFFTVQTQNKVLANPTPDHTITVVGQQWSWTFNYEDEDAVDGQTVHDVGTPSEMPTLVLPVNQTVRFHLHSPDVVHSFWVPNFLMKLDVVPGRDNYFTATPDKIGTYVGRCAELCGTYHSRMLFSVEVVEQAEYEEHLRALEEAGNVGRLMGGEGSASAEDRASEQEQQDLDDDYDTGDDE
ncbi:cytochrome c oxidase subunit 2 [Nocardioides massiliensis]|uniref:cytochrome-c oxidase n=1 Tax=Nocardioides massiliensis TaxID=1325935 RepID=A0ABT9NT55_9ACTN|nr:cytochrome c oxidase subunit II [Nocardioides massiliensis]MDP9823588.1 cytochrome c oxidase subunit 2 [Nocardioides massiliensis]